MAIPIPRWLFIPFARLPKQYMPRVKVAIEPRLSLRKILLLTFLTILSSYVLQ